MPRFPEHLRQQVIERAQGLCEYCQSAQLIVVALEIDHIRPPTLGGSKLDLKNLASACRPCNNFKLDFLTGIDPKSKQEVDSFNPRTQRWDEHFKWSDNGTIIIGLTSNGRATIDRLRMNREGVVASRRLWVQVGWHPPKSGRFPNL